ncbi:uncharacterized protein LOC134749322 [Cydia strobilella]|uniref:uncharacterized protein LOC134749322 n=1 Tax=Cydia strobilella TaxID=1100964 RepID=UPI0030064B67
MRHHVTCFHLHNKLANYELNVHWQGKRLTHNFAPKYLGVTLDRSLTFKEHLTKLGRKLQTRNNILNKLASTSWGANADCLRTSALALVYSTADYCSPVWLESAHTDRVDVELNKSMRCISGTILSTPTYWLPVLCNIAPARLRREEALLRETQKLITTVVLPGRQEFLNPYYHRLKSRHPPCKLAKTLTESRLSLKEKWSSDWQSKTDLSVSSLISPGVKVKGFSLPRHEWCKLNRMRTGFGRTAHFKHLCGWIDSPRCDCGAESQTVQHIVQECPLRAYPGSPDDLFSLTPDAAQWLRTLDINL